MIIIMAIGLILFGVHFYMANIHTPQNIIRTARKESELTEGSYILTRFHRVTGFDWMLIQNENGESVQEHINIIGANPITELSLSYEFTRMGRNTYIFYIEERIEEYTVGRGIEVQYVVTGWDILYPVRRINFISPRRYITEADTWGD